MENKIPPPQSFINVAGPNMSFLEEILVCCSTEDWRNEDFETYDPTNYSRNRLVLRAVMGLSKSRRRRIRQQERARFRKKEFTCIQNLEKLKIRDDSTNENNDTELSIRERQSLSEIKQKFQELNISH